jgi:hypothetical protein
VVQVQGWEQVVSCALHLPPLQGAATRGTPHPALLSGQVQAPAVSLPAPPQQLLQQL